VEACYRVKGPWPPQKLSKPLIFFFFFKGLNPLQHGSSMSIKKCTLDKEKRGKICFSTTLKFLSKPQSPRHPAPRKRKEKNVCRLVVVKKPRGERRIALETTRDPRSFYASMSIVHAPPLAGSKHQSSLISAP